MSDTRPQLIADTTAALLDNVSQDITPAALRNLLVRVLNACYNLNSDPAKENQGVADALMAELKGGVAADGNTLAKLRELIRAVEASGGSPARTVIAAPNDGIIGSTFHSKIITISCASLTRTLQFPDPATNPTFYCTIRRTDNNPATGCLFTCLGTGVFEEGDGINLLGKSNITIQSDGTNYITVAH